MLQNQRRTEILRLLTNAGSMSFKQLSKSLNVSHMTVRRDVAALAEENLVRVVPGGAELFGWKNGRPPLERKLRQQLEAPQKIAIARKAAELISDGDVIFLDSGTTCQAVVPYLRQKQGLTVVTNDLYSAVDLVTCQNIDCVFAGGIVDKDTGSCMGSISPSALSGILIDTCFLGAPSWDNEHGLSTPDRGKYEMKRAIMGMSTSVYLLADSTKYGTRERFVVAALSELDGVISDSGVPESVREMFAEQEATALILADDPATGPTGVDADSASV